ncbi:MAG: dethiobiotin synthase [Gammaproteobacteria bacterium]|nr:dethiobiotin synthase [Gammaproteobacteria bacterium]MDH5727658.1 dethiobiotin synthase [Gammaproteobacteria bacterium]
MTGIFITGTDTDAGKTVIAAALIHCMAQTGKRVVGMKPVASGAVQTNNGLNSTDLELLQSQSNVNFPLALICPYMFQAPVSPNIAAAQTGVTISLNKISECYQQVASSCDYVVVEGVGGWKAPLNHEQDVSDLVRHLNLPVILVVGLRLGCINHALLSLQSIRASQVPIIGWVANVLEPDMHSANEVMTTLCDRLSLPLIGHIPYFSQLSIEKIAALLNLDPILNPAPSK